MSVSDLSMHEAVATGHETMRESWLNAVKRDPDVGRTVDRMVGVLIAAALLVTGVAPIFGEFDRWQEDILGWRVAIGLICMMAAFYRPNLFSPVSLILASLGLALHAIFTGRIFGLRGRRNPLTGRIKRRR